MERIWNFFENMNEYVYVADADTHELVYMNKKMRDTYGIHSKEELAGKKCYELLQNSSLPCTICNNDELQEGQFKEWRYFHEGKPLPTFDLQFMSTLQACLKGIAIAKNNGAI